MKHRVALGVLPLLLSTAAGIAQQVVQGRVVDENGKPIGGARVLLHEGAASAMPLGTTDTDGRYAMVLPPAREGSATLWLGIEADGRAGVRTPLIPAASALARPTLMLDRGTTLHGRVRDTIGRPIANARVRVTALHDARLGASIWLLDTATTSSANGIFKLPGVPPANLRLQVDADGCYRQYLAPVALGTPLEIELRQSGPITGRVVHPDGRPAAATIAIAWEGEDDITQVATDGDGRFRATWILPVHARITATAPGGLVAFSDVLTAPVADLRLQLRAHTEVPGVHVRATGDGGAPLTGFRASVSWHGHEQPDEYLWQRFALGAAATRDGALSLPPPDSQQEREGTLMLVAPGRAVAFETVTWPEDGERGLEIVVATTPGRTLRGNLVDTAGKPVAGARVWAWRERETHWVMPGATPDTGAIVTGADGTFELDWLTAGRWRIHAAHGCQIEPKSRTVEIQGDGAPEPLHLVLPEVVPARGRVLGARAAWSVALSPAVVHPQLGELAPYTNRCYPDADGAIAAPALILGNLAPWVLCPRPHHAGAELALPLPTLRLRRDEDFELDASLTGPGTLRGRVQFAGLTVPHDRLLVQVKTVSSALLGQPFQWDWDEEGWNSSTLVAADGTFTALVVPGKQRVRVRDVLTGVVLARTSDPVEVEALATAEVTVPVDVGAIEVELVPTAADERGPAHFLRLSSGGDEDTYGWPAPGLRLTDRLCSRVLYLPTGNGRATTALAALPPVGTVLERRWYPDVSTEGDRIEFEVESGKTIPVRVEVPRRQ